MATLKEKDARTNLGCGLLVTAFGLFMVWLIGHFILDDVHGHVIGKGRHKASASEIRVKDHTRSRQRGRAVYDTHRSGSRHWPVRVLLDSGEKVWLSDAPEAIWRSAAIGQRIDKDRGIFGRYVLGAVDDRLAEEYADADETVRDP